MLYLKKLEKRLEKYMKKTDKIKLKLWEIILLLVGCIALNLGGKYLAATLELPVWLDVIGVFVAAYFTGPVGCIVTGVCSNLIYGLQDAGAVWYMITSVAVGLMFYLFVRRGYVKDVTKVMISSSVIGIGAVVISVPINIMCKGGLTGNIWGDALFDMLDWYGIPKIICAIGDEFIVDMIDKQLCVLIAYFIINGIVRISKSKNIKSSSTTVLSMMLITSLLVTSFGVSSYVWADTEENVTETDIFKGQYLGTIYDSSNGMQVSEANCIAETDDGYIWIGSYAGLTKYDGCSFEFITEGGITNVTAMHKGRDGSLWIGTNDKGVAKYKDGKYTFYGIKNGLSAASVRCFAEDKNGNIYIGTTDKICVVDINGELSEIAGGITYAVSLDYAADSLIGVTNDGTLFLISDGELKDSKAMEKDTGYFTCEYVDGDTVYVGTSLNYIVTAKVENGKLILGEQIDTDSLETFSSIEKDDLGRIWLCTSSGFGYLYGGKLYVNQYPGFDRSIESMHQDYEGNIWLSSSRYGVLKLCKNLFANIFNMSDISERVVNAVVIYRDKFVCGTDNGLVIIDKKTNMPVTNELTEYLDGTRIRNVYVNSENVLWISTYGEQGLVKVSSDGSISNFNMQSHGTTSDRFRCALELPNGEMMFGTNDGINIIKDDKLIGTIRNEDGLKISQILCLVSKDKTKVYAGSDGAGIYIIEDGKIIGNLTTEDGLSSDVILRIIPDNTGGFFIVTSNSLCYMKDDVIKILTEFPYFNNYDVIMNGSEAYVLSSNGIYIVEAEQLRENTEKLSYKHYNILDGLTGNITANSWNYLDEKGYLYICCNNGLMRYSYNGEKEEVDYKYSLDYVSVDGKIIKEEDGVFNIDENAARIYVKASVRNYSFSRPKVRLYIEGVDLNSEVMTQDELEQIQISNLSHGTYTIHLQLLSDDEATIISEKNYKLVKHSRMWENSWYISYLVVVGVWIIVYITWIILVLINISKRRKELEIISDELEQKVEEQTEAIINQSKKMEKFQWSVIESMASLIEGRDGNTGEHVINTRRYVSIIAKEMLRRGLHPEIITPEYVENLVRSAPLHDVGKIKISDTILNKPGKFTPEEFEVMKKHSVYGGEIIENVLGEDADEELINVARDVALYHHEKWNGKGYPEGKTGEDIPLAARIMAVADVFDALISKRVYKESMSLDEAFDIIMKDSGIHFDPEVAKVFIDMRPEVEKQNGN